MFKHKPPSPIIEMTKSIAIVALLCSAIFLFQQSQILISAPYVQFGTTPPTSDTEIGSDFQSATARPVRMAIISGIEDSGGIYGVQYDSDAVDALFQPASTLLQEVLGSLSPPVEIAEYQWRLALSTSTSIYFDMLGSIPISVLSNWLSQRTDGSLTASAQHLILTVGEDNSVSLLYQDSDNGNFYACNSTVVDAMRLLSLVAQYPGNGTSFAFESDKFQSLNPYTMISGTTPTPRVYDAVNPLNSAEQELLLSLLSFDSHTNAIYNSPDGIVVRNGSDTLRLYDNGTLTYQGEIGASRYPIASQFETPTLFDIVESCRQLMQQTIGRYRGDARLHLLSTEDTENGLLIRFGYSLDGALVQFPVDATAAEFFVLDGEITSFTLRFRTYTATEATTILLPEEQAIAAMAAMEYDGRELLLSYYDNDAPQLTADWVAGTY